MVFACGTNRTCCGGHAPAGLLLMQRPCPRRRHWTASAPAAPDPHTVSALCTRMTLSLIPPGVRGSATAELGQAGVSAPPCRPRAGPWGSQRSSLWVDLVGIA